MKRVRVKKMVAINNLLKPSMVITRDIADRIIQWVYTYTSVVVTYDVVWAGPSGSAITSVTQTITDL